jgi:hypothetical protein
MTALIPQMRINHSIKASRSAFPLDRCSIMLSQYVSNCFMVRVYTHYPPQSFDRHQKDTIQCKI